MVAVAGAASVALICWPRPCEIIKDRAVGALIATAMIRKVPQGSDHPAHVADALFPIADVRCCEPLYFP